MTVAPARLTSLDVVLADALPDPAKVDGAPRLREQADQRLLEALRAVGGGNFSTRLAVEPGGVPHEIAEAFNDIVDANQQTLRELRRIQRTVGAAGRIRERASVATLGGDWDLMLGAVNQLLDEVTAPTLEVSRVLGAVARGD